MAARSYVWPSMQNTGSLNKLCDNGHRKLISSRFFMSSCLWCLRGSFVLPEEAGVDIDDDGDDVVVVVEVSETLMLLPTLDVSILVILEVLTGVVVGVEDVKTEVR